MPSSLRAADFTGSFGINVHLQDMNSAAKTGATLAALTYLGIDTVRSPLGGALLQSNSIAAKLADAGIKIDALLTAKNAPADSIASLSAFAKAHPGSISSIEGPNEINLWPVTYNGLTGAQGGVAFLNAAITAAKADPALAGTKFFDLTGPSASALLGGDQSGFANVHVYPSADVEPFTKLQKAVSGMGVAGKGIVITEAGYSTALGEQGVDATTQAKLTLNLMADATKLGVAETFLYQLADYADPTGTSFNKNLGLFDSKFQPKLAATAIHNMTGILADNGANAHGFTTHNLDYSITGLPQGGSSLLLEKSSGAFDLMLWAEPDIWDAKTHTAISVAATQTSVSLAAHHADVLLFDPLQSDQPVASYHDVTSFTLAVSDHPLIAQILLLDSAPVVTAPATYAAPLTLKGDGDANTLVGGAGNDVLIGKGGADILTGGGGADRFVYNMITDSLPTGGKWDQIMDFHAAEGDRIDLSGIDANRAMAGDQAFFLVGNHFTHQAGQLIQFAYGDGMMVQGDNNGDGRADFAIMLHHVTQALTADAFVL